MTDQLTQLGNRRYLEKQIIQLIEENKKAQHVVSTLLQQDEFLHQCDEALYLAKDHGRNCIFQYKFKKADCNPYSIDM